MSYTFPRKYHCNKGHEFMWTPSGSYPFVTPDDVPLCHVCLMIFLVSNIGLPTVGNVIRYGEEITNSSPSPQKHEHHSI